MTGYMHPPMRLKPYAAKDSDGLNVGWAARHNDAIRSPQGDEKGIVKMLRGWEDHADQYRKRFESSIGSDGFLGPEWEAIGDALRGLLNGPLGRLDGGTLDGAILIIMGANDVDTSEK